MRVWDRSLRKMEVSIAPHNASRLPLGHAWPESHEPRLPPPHALIQAASEILSVGV